MFALATRTFANDATSVRGKLGTEAELAMLCYTFPHELQTVSISEPHRDANSVGNWRHAS